MATPVWSRSLVRFAFAVAGLQIAIGDLVAADRPEIQTKPPAESPVLKRILANWQTRQDRVKSFHAVWNTTSVLPNWGAHGEQPHLLNHEVWMIDPEHYCFEASFVDHRSGKQRNLSWHRRATSDGKLQTHFERVAKFKLPGQAEAAGDGEILDGTMGWIGYPADESFLSPLKLALSPSQSTGYLGQIPFRLITEKAIVDGIHCVKLQRSGDRLVETCWVHPTRDQVVVCWQLGMVTIHEFLVSISIDYRHDQERGWLPSQWWTSGRWTASAWQESAAATAKSTVTRLNLNVKFPSGTFDARFPTGTRVFDQPAKAEYTIGQRGAKTNMFKVDSNAAEEIEQMLNASADFIIDSQPLADALRSIESKYRVVVLVKGKPLDQAGLDPKINVKSALLIAPLRQVLKDLLSQYPRPVDLEIRFRDRGVKPLLTQ